MNRSSLSALLTNPLLLGALVLALLAGAASYVVAKHRWAQSQLEAVGPRHARLVGLHANRAALDAAVAQRRTLLARHVYPSSQDATQAGSDAQQRVREIFVRAGLAVSSTQLLAPKAVGGFDRIPVMLRVDGDLAALQGALVVLGGQSPSVLIDTLTVQTPITARQEGAPRLSVQVNLFVLRARS